MLIRDKDCGTILAQGEPGTDIEPSEGNLHIRPEAVARDVLKVIGGTDTRPDKGTRNRVEFVGRAGQAVKDAARIDPAPRPGHKILKDRFDFYAGSRGATRQDETNLDTRKGPPPCSAFCSVRHDAVAMA